MKEILNLLEKYNITQVHTSKNENVNEYLKSSMYKYDSKLKSTLFYGLNTVNDLLTFVNHRGSKFIYWTFCNDNVLNKIFVKLTNVEMHFCNNEKIYELAPMVVQGVDKLKKWSESL